MSDLSPKHKVSLLYDVAIKYVEDEIIKRKYFICRNVKSKKIHENNKNCVNSQINFNSLGM